MTNNTGMKPGRTTFLVSLAILSIVISIIFGLATIYSNMKEPRTHISYDLISESNILDIHQPLRELEVRYRGEDIHAQSKNLRILRLKVENDGEMHIRPADFDPKIPWGVKINNGQIVEIPKLVDSNSDYIRKNLEPMFSSDTVLSFRKIQLEKGKYFIVEIQVLHPIDQDPLMTILGKVIGMESQEILYPDKTVEKPSFWSSVFYGSPTVQFFRVIIFFFLTFLALILIGLAVTRIEEKRQSNKTQESLSRIEKYLTPVFEGKIQLEKNFILIVFLQARCSISELEFAQTVLTTPKLLDGMMNIMNTFYKLDKRYLRLQFFELPILKLPADLVTIEKDKKQIDIHPELLNTVNELLEFMKNNRPPRKLIDGNSPLEIINLLKKQDSYYKSIIPPPPPPPPS